MTARDLVEAFSREDFLRELHHLLWIEPQLNRGDRDEGWNCRDHALVVAGVAQMLGFKSALNYGHLALVHGRRGASKPLWFNVSPHSWVGVQGAGHYDLSLRLGGVPVGGERLDWDVAGLIGDRFVSSDHVRVVWSYRPEEYNDAIEVAGQLSDTKTAIYGCETLSELSARDVSNSLDVCNSLLTDWLRSEFGGRQDLHANAILHLVDFLDGKSTSLTSLPRIDAWRAVARRPGNAVWRVCTRGKLD